MGINSVSMKYQFKTSTALRGQRARIVLESNSRKDAMARLPLECDESTGSKAELEATATVTRSFDAVSKVIGEATP